MRTCQTLFRLLGVVGLSTVMVACESEPETPPEVPTEIGESAPPEIIVTATNYSALSDWEKDHFEGFLQAFGRSCARLLKADPDRDVGTDAISMTASDWTDVCANLPNDADQKEIQQYFETNFTPFSVQDVSKNTGNGDLNDSFDGLFTGYFEAELKGARVSSETFSTPIYARPNNLVTVDLGRFDPDLKGKGVVGAVSEGRLIPYPTRGEIEAGSLKDQGLEILWIDDPVDVFLLQVQGSGRVILPDGDVVRVGFAAHNGHGYRSIGRHLIDQGELESHEASWQGIRKWIDANPDQSAALFAHNPRFIFFRELQGEGPIGAEGVALTPMRSLAVDTRYVPLGVPLWLDTTVPGGSEDPLRRLMVAQDKGGAIKGVVRGDFFWGYGAAALAKAGRMKSRGRYFLLLPKGVADRLSAGS